MRFSGSSLFFLGFFLVWSNAHAQQPATSELVDLPLEQLLQFDVASRSAAAAPVSAPEPPETAKPGNETGSARQSERVAIVDPDPLIDTPWMLPEVSKFGIGYHFITARYEAHQEGRRVVSSGEALDRFGRLMTRMDVESNLFTFAYRPNEKWMVHVGVPFLRVGGDVEAADGSSFSFHVDGISDVDLNVSRFFYLTPQTQLALNLGLGFPTGTIDAQRNGVVLPYSLQLGSGTWDLSPGIAISREFGRLEMGALAEAEIHPGENDNGYRFGNSIGGSLWAHYNVSPYVVLGGFLRGGFQEAVEDPNPSGAALHRNPANYGGGYLESGISARLLHPSCPYGGKFLEFRASKPIWQDANGIHLVRDWMLEFGIGFSF